MNSKVRLVTEILMIDKIIQIHQRCVLRGQNPGFWIVAGLS